MDRQAWRVKCVKLKASRTIATVNSRPAQNRFVGSVWLNMTSPKLTAMNAALASPVMVFGKMFDDSRWRQVDRHSRPTKMTANRRTRAPIAIAKPINSRRG